MKKVMQMQINFINRLKDFITELKLKVSPRPMNASLIQLSRLQLVMLLDELPKEVLTQIEKDPTNLENVTSSLQFQDLSGYFKDIKAPALQRLYVARMIVVFFNKERRISRCSVPLKDTYSNTTKSSTVAFAHKKEAGMVSVKGHCQECEASWEGGGIALQAIRYFPDTGHKIPVEQAIWWTWELRMVASGEA